MADVTMNDLVVEYAQDVARKEAQEVIEMIRASDEKIVFITDNRYFPPLRGYGSADRFYDPEGADESQIYSPFESYMDTFFDELEKADVACETPEDDNALFVVNCQKYEFVDDEWVEKDESDTQKYHFTVAVHSQSLEQAQKVMSERLEPDEDYGFDYRLEFWFSDIVPEKKDQ